ncbi:unnamed protein product [Cylicocyclus nassatus]|uniref:Myotubularin phosphatase domain-containing protein n=1 Tax=Cylicocyclus nassatus TaxID=53992 RepID=A0AA36M398_CYLNA|nr:unnamed protein product [Cylicocyclus nassatus]
MLGWLFPKAFITQSGEKCNSDVGIMSATNTTFHSYIEDQSFDHTKPKPTTEIRIGTDLPTPGSSHDLLEGEIECAFCENCFFVWPFTENGFGRVVCTNFRLRFQSSPKTESALPARFKVFNEQWDIPLCSIHSLHYEPVRISENQSSFFKKKFIHVVKSLSSLEIVSSIRLQLKDFRVVTIDLRESQHAASLLNQILFFSRPHKIENIIQAGAEREWCSSLQFNDTKSWEAELERCGLRNNYHWRVASQLQGPRQYFLCKSYPKYFVVPGDTTNYELSRMAEHWTLSRFPIWVWARLSTGVSLLRSSKFDENWEAPKLNKVFAKYVSRATGSEDLEPHSLVLNDDTSPMKISAAYGRLRRLCSVDSYEQFASRDKDWLARINHTGWLHLVSKCLVKAAEGVEWLTRGRSVIIYETEGLDASAVVSSIIQICCDSYYREPLGLESLIAKDWIALGHPFAQRLFGNSNENGEEEITPTFLLFLDCVAQLIRLYPMQFTYSHHLLIALWDLSLTGMVPAFAASSVADQDQLGMRKCGGPFPLERFFQENYIRLFENVTNMAAVTVQNAYETNLTEDIIRPPRSIISVQLWNECYLRWIPPANIKRGGNLFTDIALKESIRNLPAGRLMIDEEPEWPPETNVDKVSSAYPYSEADVGNRGYVNRDDSDNISMSSMSLSTASYMTQDDRYRHRASVPVLGGIPEQIPKFSPLRPNYESSSTSSSSAFTKNVVLNPSNLSSIPRRRPYPRLRDRLS